MRRFYLAAGTLATLGLAAAGGAVAVLGHPTTAPSATGGPAAQTSPDPRPVLTHRVTAAATAGRSYTGVVKARRETDLGFRVGGKVVARTAEVGDRVTAGTALARLDPTDFELAAQVAEADLASARADAGNAAKEEARHRRLAGGAVSQSELDRVADGRKAADARLDRAERALALAKNRLGYCTLVAGVDGVVTALPVEVGQVVGEGQAVARVAHAGEWEAVVHLPEHRMTDARTPDARLTVWGEAGRGHPVTLRELSPTADPLTRTYQARFTVHAPGPELALGRTVTVHLAPAAPRPALTVPLTAVRQQDGRPAVWRVDGDRLVSVPVTVEAYRDEVAVVSAGVAAGDVVVAAGVQKLDAGLRVRPWEGK